MHCPRSTNSPLATAQTSRSGRAFRLMVTSEPASELWTQTLGCAATSRRARGAHRRSRQPETSRPGYVQILPPSGFEVISGRANAPTVPTHQATTASQRIAPSRPLPDTVTIRRQHQEASPAPSRHRIRPQDDRAGPPPEPARPLARHRRKITLSEARRPPADDSSTEESGARFSSGSAVSRVQRMPERSKRSRIRFLHAPWPPTERGAALTSSEPRQFPQARLPTPTWLGRKSGGRSDIH